MDESLDQWQSSSAMEDNSIVISDSEEDVQEGSEKRRIFVVESSESSVNVSANLTPEMGRFSSSRITPLTERAIRQRLKKHIPCYSDSEDDSDRVEGEFLSSSRSMEVDSSYSPSHDEEEAVERCGKAKKGGESRRVLQENRNEFERNAFRVSKLESSNESWREGNISGESTDHQKSAISIDSDKENWLESELAVSIAKREIGVGNVDPLVAQKRALLVCKMEQLQSQLSKTKVRPRCFTLGAAAGKDARKYGNKKSSVDFHGLAAKGKPFSTKARRNGS